MKPFVVVGPLWIFLASATVCWADPPQRLPIPAAAEQQVSRQVIAEAYRSQYEEAKTDAEKLALAEKLLIVASETNDDPSGRFTLCHIAKEIAIQQGNLPVALHAGDIASKHFQLDRWTWCQEAVDSAAAKSKTAMEHRTISSLVFHLSHVAIDDDQFDVADHLATTALELARKGNEKSQIDACSVLLQRIAFIKTLYATAKPAFEKLKLDSLHPDANAEAGKFLCFVKGNWQEGISLLAKGSDDKLKKIAQSELDPHADQVEVADAWWNVSETLDPNLQDEVQLHAGKLYQKTLPSLSGLTADKVRARLETIPQLNTAPSPPEPQPPSPRPKYPFPDVWHNDSYATTMTRQGKRWVERNKSNNQVRLTYVEVDRDKNYVVLFCNERKNRMRLHKSGRAELEKNGKWSWVANGHWE